ncbi:inactive protein RESTRICTED TEV MOVEMENT 2-like [Quillaja saponaria]|uniref:Inactive protein RESTRICTED TEV MOVEMENT 2-like n=1 Tax=Quillaja saponaria TaxID=32244 RepID=A0AAD7LEF6_QUISA|nr:inactive protein RESTRICTED TEV MOVEMENT 2-like [Quillaja saponaria]
MANVRGTRVGGRSRLLTSIVEEFIPDSGWTEDTNGHYLLVDLPGFTKDDVKLRVDNTGHVIISGERKVNEDKSIHFEQTFEVPSNSDIDKITGKIDSEILYVTFPKQAEEEIIESTEAPKEEANIGRENLQENEVEEEANIGRENLLENEVEEEANIGKGKLQENEVSNVTENTKRDSNGHGSNHNEKKEKRTGDSHIGGFPEEFIRKWEQEPNILTSAMKVLSKNKGIVITAVLAFSLGVLVSRKFS